MLSRGPSGNRIARSCRHTGPDLTIETRGERQDRKLLLSQYVLGSGALSIHDCMPAIKQKQPQDRKAAFEALPLPVAKILSPVARQAPAKCKKFLPQNEQNLQRIGVCAMTTKFLDNKMFKFNFFLSMLFFFHEKTVFWDDFPLCPPSQKRIFLFVVSPSLTKLDDLGETIFRKRHK